MYHIIGDKRRHFDTCIYNQFVEKKIKLKKSMPCEILIIH